MLAPNPTLDHTQQGQDLSYTILLSKSKMICILQTHTHTHIQYRPRFKCMSHAEKDGPKQAAG